jgi:WD40 repeat protein/DNA-binding winged helix-turn-helix (wHTH) protein
VTQATERAIKAGAPFRVGKWLVEPRLNRLTRREESTQIELKMMDVLVCLADQTLIDTVWATEFISENILTRAIAELRNVLGDDARNPSFIETIHRKGYRLIAPIERVASDDPSTAKVARFPVPEARVQDERSPYPGLSAFTEEDAEFFFGREAEVTQLWRKLTGRRLLALIGPSGVGKSSLLRAGLIPAAPQGWSAIVCQPGDSPYPALARALAPEFRDDPDAIAKLVDIRDEDTAVAVLARWRGLHDHVLLVIDQFEEIFTQNAWEVQDEFIRMLRRAADQADVNVLLAMRDDFLIACNDHGSLSPVFSDLTPIKTPARSALRRALVNPASGHGYTFENDDLVDQMLDEVEGEQGALPMLAFTVARLWDERDRERRQLTTEAYERIGGVHGSLALHAEGTLESVGRERHTIVRELFRNLVTAQGTRATREVDDLLSVFEDRGEAAQVLAVLTDARLLNVSEVIDDEGTPRRSVEVVHESLLTSWPRLVRWQTQDAGAAQLRDELRQAARLWDDHERSNDYLWTGKAFREFSLWRENYPGGLSELEEDFARAMIIDDRRRKRRRRIWAASVVAVAVIVAVIFGVLWQRSVQEARRAEASKLLAFGERELDNDSTEALAWAIASIGLADSLEAREFVVEALSKTPPTTHLEGTGNSGRRARFSPDGRWLAFSANDEVVLVYSENGGQPLRLPGHRVTPSGGNRTAWTATGLLVTGHDRENRVRVWSMPEGRLVQTIEFSARTLWQVGERHLFARVFDQVVDGKPHAFRLQRWLLPDGQPDDIGFFDRREFGLKDRYGRFGARGEYFVYALGNTVYRRSLPLQKNGETRTLANHEKDPFILTPRSNEPDFIWTEERATRERWCWSLSQPSSKPLEILAPLPFNDRLYIVKSVKGSWRFQGTPWGQQASGKDPLLIDTGWLPGARPLELRTNRDWYLSKAEIHPKGTWLVIPADQGNRPVFWPLEQVYPSIVEGYIRDFHAVAFSPDGKWLASGWTDRRIRLWPLTGPDRQIRILDEPHTSPFTRFAFDPTGNRLVTAAYGDEIYIVAFDGSRPQRLEGFSRDHIMIRAAFSPSGRRVAAATYFGSVEKKVLRVWDLNTGETLVFDLHDTNLGDGTAIGEVDIDEGLRDGIWGIAFEDESTLYTSGAGGVRRWNVEKGSSEVVFRQPADTVTMMSTSSDRTIMLTLTWRMEEPDSGRTLVFHDLASSESRVLETFGHNIKDIALSSNGDIVVTGNHDGTVRVGRVDDDDPHLLFGHMAAVDEIAISPDLKWIASADQDDVLRLWPLPDLDKPPLHTLPHDELIAKLHTLTNLRAVRDEEAPSGWKIEVGPFPGWAEVPEW